MSIEQFINQIPKVDLYLQFEGALPKETLLLIADESNIIATMKPREYNEIIGYINRPEPKKYDDIARIVGGWLKIPEDLTRAVYDIGVKLYKQNIRYAEVFISPALYTDAGLTFEQFIDAINDGRDRVLRAWKVRMDWVLTIPRDRPRKGDDISRWVTSATARKGNVIGLGLVGREDSQAVAQFAKPFQAAQKRELPTATHAKSYPNTEPLAEILEALNPSRLLDIWGVAENPADLQLIAEKNLHAVVTPSRELRLGRVASLGAYPLRQLMSVIPVSLGSGMPELYGTTLTDEYKQIAKSLELAKDDIVQLAKNGINSSFLEENEKQALLDELESFVKNTELAS